MHCGGCQAARRHRGSPLCHLGQSPRSSGAAGLTSTRAPGSCHGQAQASSPRSPRDSKRRKTGRSPLQPALHDPTRGTSPGWPRYASACGSPPWCGRRMSRTARPSAAQSFDGPPAALPHHRHHVGRMGRRRRRPPCEQLAPPISSFATLSWASWLQSAAPACECHARAHRSHLAHLARASSAILTRPIKSLPLHREVYIQAQVGFLHGLHVSVHASGSSSTFSVPHLGSGTQGPLPRWSRSRPAGPVSPRAPRHVCWGKGTWVVGPKGPDFCALAPVTAAWSVRVARRVQLRLSLRLCSPRPRPVVLCARQGSYTELARPPSLISTEWNWCICTASIASPPTLSTIAVCTHGRQKRLRCPQSTRSSAFSATLAHKRPRKYGRSFSHLPHAHPSAHGLHRGRPRKLYVREELSCYFLTVAYVLGTHPLSLRRNMRAQANALLKNRSALQATKTARFYSVSFCQMSALTSAHCTQCGRLALARHVQLSSHGFVSTVMSRDSHRLWRHAGGWTFQPHRKRLYFPRGGLQQLFQHGHA